MIFIMTSFPFKYFSCFCKNCKIGLQKKIFEYGKTIMEEDFDIYQIINNERKLKFTLMQLKKLLKLK